MKLQGNYLIKGILGIVLIGLIVLLCWAFLPKKFNESLSEYSFSEYNHSIGSSYRTYVKAVDDSHAVITQVDTEVHDAVPAVQEYLVNISVLKEIEEVFRSYNMSTYERRPEWKKVSNGQGSFTCRFTFGSETTSFSGTQLISPFFSLGKSQIESIINMYADEGEKLPGFTSEHHDTYTIANGKVAAEITAYYDHTLTYMIANETEDNVIVSSLVALYKEGSDEPICSISEEKAEILVPGQRQSYTLPLKERLEEGIYRLELSTGSVIFSIRK